MCQKNATKLFKPVWNNEKMLFSERLTYATDYIEFKSKNGNAAEACWTIERIISEGKKFRLFKKFFPNEWRRSKASFVKKGFYEHYSQRADEFFALVNEHLFPLFLGWNEDPEAEFDPFMIFSLNIDFCCADIDYEYIGIGYVCGLLIFSQDEEIWEFFKQKYKFCEKDLPAINTNFHEKLWHLDKIPEIAPYLNLFEVVDHSTGNPWLDLSNCCQYGETFDWDEKTIEFLTKSYEEALKILEQMECLDNLIEADPKNYLFNLITLWNDGCLLSS
jgi:hypothetical protein